MPETDPARPLRRKLIGDSAAEQRALENQIREKRRAGVPVGNREEELAALQERARVFNEARKKKKLGDNIYKQN